MSLTLSQFLWLVLTFAAVVGVTFLVVFLIQLRRTAREAEKTLIEMRVLTGSLQVTSQKINQKLDDLGSLVEAAQKTANGLSNVSWYLSTKVARPGYRYWPMVVPFLRWVWRRWRKKKEETNG